MSPASGIDTDGIEEFFRTGGPLSGALDSYEPRPAQTQIAVAIADALERGGHLVAEAGTGTGKTLAYLVPALASGLKVVVSTGTKNLQEQLLFQDLPILERSAGRDFCEQVMKGRTNYLCELRYEQVSAQPELPSLDRGALWSTLAQWRETTHTGDRAELAELGDSSELWRELSVTSDQCTGRRCAHFDRCWVTRMRRRAQEADLVVVNHHLYFADAVLREVMGGSGASIIPAHDAVIFDEAHELDEIASQHYGFNVSERRLHELGRDISKAATTDDGTGMTSRLAGLLGQLDLRASHLFESLPYGHGRTPVEPKRLSSHVTDHFARVDDVLEGITAELSSAGHEELTLLAGRAARLGAELAFALGQHSRASDLADLERPMAHPDPQSQGGEPEYNRDGRERVPYVRFTEQNGRHRALMARPLDVAPLVRKTLEKVPAAFVSATLAVGGSFKHFRQRLGVPEDASEVQVDSPFDYGTQTRLYIPTDLPPPESPDFNSAAALRAQQLIEAAGGGAFVLCTSHRALQSMREVIAAHLPDHLILTQGEGSRSHLLEQFREDGHAILIATMSFWRGVDVPGSALRLVIIDKLPFASPSDPLVGAKLAHLKASGQSAFSTYQLPQAALLLRQGFGRLIRRQSDQGLVAILDKRIRTKSYGRLLLRSLPKSPEIEHLEDALNYLETVDAAIEDAP